MGDIADFNVALPLQCHHSAMAMPALHTGEGQSDD